MKHIILFLLLSSPSCLFAAIPTTSFGFEFGTNASDSQTFSSSFHHQLNFNFILSGLYQYNMYELEGEEIASDNYQITTLFNPYGNNSLSLTYKFWGARDYFFVDAFHAELSAILTDNWAINFESENGSLTLMRPFMEGNLQTDNFYALGIKINYSHSTNYYEVGYIDYVYPNTYEKAAGEAASIIFPPQSISDFSRLIDFSAHILLSKKFKKYLTSLQIRHTRSQVDSTLALEVIGSLSYQLSKKILLTTSGSVSEAEDNYDGTSYQQFYYTVGTEITF